MHVLVLSTARRAVTWLARAAHGVALLATLMCAVAALLNLQEVSDSTFSLVVLEFPHRCDDDAICIDAFHNFVWSVAMCSVCSLLLAVVVSARLLGCPHCAFVAASPLRRLSSASASAIGDGHKAAAASQQQPADASIDVAHTPVDVTLCALQGMLVFGQVGIVGAIFSLFAVGAAALLALELVVRGLLSC